MTAVPISLELDCCGEPLAERTFEQLSSGRYEWPCSVLRLPTGIEDYLAERRTARKRAARCLRLGYVFREIDRTEYVDDIVRVNISAPVRQGRPMAGSYRERPEFSPLPVYACPRHAVRTYGVLEGGRLVAYAWVYRVGELVMFSSILGHADYLRDDVMYLLVVEALRDQLGSGPGFAFYNMHDSGTDGLRFFKERLGFRPARVEWRP